MHFTPDTAQHSGQAEVTSAVTGDPATTPAKVPTTGAPHFPHSGGIVWCVTWVFVSGCTWSLVYLLQLQNWLVINSLKAGRPANKADRRYIDEERLCLLCITPEKEFMWRMQADHLLAIFASVCMSAEICIFRHRYLATGPPVSLHSVWAGYEVLLTSPLSALLSMGGRAVSWEP